MRQAAALHGARVDLVRVRCARGTRLILSGEMPRRPDPNPDLGARAAGGGRACLGRSSARALCELDTADTQRR